MLTDARRAIRALVRARWATILQLSTIAIGVGGLSAVFAVVGAVVLRPLPFEKPGELVTIDVTSSRGFTISTSMPNYRDWRDRSRTLAAYGGFTGWTFPLTRSGETRIMDGAAVYGDLFGVLRIRPELGRAIQPQETWSGARMGVAGISIGIVGAIVLSRFIESFLYGVQPLEPSIYAWCAGGVLAVTGLASLLPALASRRLTPATVLRED